MQEDVSKWELNSDFDVEVKDIIDNKELAFKYMTP
jgi:hypothetical protein